MPSQRRQGVVMADRIDADLLKETQRTHAAKFQEEKAFRQSVSSPTNKPYPYSSVVTASTHSSAYPPSAVITSTNKPVVTACPPPPGPSLYAYPNTTPPSAPPRRPPQVDVNMTKPGFLLARSERELALQRTEGEDYDSANDLLARAEIGYRSAFGIQESQNLDQVAHPEWGAFLNDKASCLIDQGRADLALALLKPSKNIQVRVFGDRTLDVAPVMCNLALAYLLTGAHKRALQVRLQEYCLSFLSTQFGCADVLHLAPTTRT